MPEYHDPNDEPREITEADIPKPKLTGPKLSNSYPVFSALHYPLNGTLWTQAPGNDPNDQPLGRDWEILPGDNFLDPELWAELKKLDGIVARLDKGELTPGKVGKIHDAEILLAPAPRSYIRRLSARADRIEDNQTFGLEGGPNTPINTRMRMMEEKIRRFTRGA